MTEVKIVTDTDLISTESDNIRAANRYLWTLIPIIAFGSTLIGAAAGLLAGGTAGCFLASCVLAYLAYQKPKKDIVSLLTPLYAVLIFFNGSIEPTLLLPIQVLYAASLTVLVFRLNARFSQTEEIKRRVADTEEEEVSDEPVPD
jgi:hypothetical protein